MGSPLGSVTAWHSSSGRQPKFAALNRGRHLDSTGRPSRWALAHIASYLCYPHCHLLLQGCLSLMNQVLHCYHTAGLNTLATASVNHPALLAVCPQHLWQTRSCSASCLYASLFCLPSVWFCLMFAHCSRNHIHLAFSSWLFMAAVHSRCGYYIFVLFLSSFFRFFLA